MHVEKRCSHQDQAPGQSPFAEGIVPGFYNQIVEFLQAQCGNREHHNQEQDVGNEPGIDRGELPVTQKQGQDNERPQSNRARQTSKKNLTFARRRRRRQRRWRCWIGFDHAQKHWRKSARFDNRQVRACESRARWKLKRAGPFYAAVTLGCSFRPSQNESTVFSIWTSASKLTGFTR